MCIYTYLKSRVRPYLSSSLFTAAAAVVGGPVQEK